jgi:ubiquinone/menaquinone biosynthesis C-methylase UbiE
MLAKSGIDKSSLVLDIGCGNGNTAIWIAENRPCKITGIDLSGVRAGNAAEAAAKLDSELSARLRFEKASATALPFEDGSFSHVWSQATIYHVPDKEAVLDEAYRVLAKGGTFIFDDLTKPKPQVSEQAQKYVYDRLLYDTPFSFTGYQDSLKAHGFEVVEAEALSSHLKTSYEKLREMAGDATARGLGDFTGLVTAYEHMAAAITEGDLGWALYVCKK